MERQYQAWLLQLCDPEGYENLPHVRLDVAGVGKLLEAAQQH